MANALQIITNALARLGAVGANRTPADADQELGLQTLQDMLRRLIYSGALGARKTITPAGAYTAGENEHIYRNSEMVTAIDLPEFVANDSEWSSDYGRMVLGAEKRTPRDGAFIIITDLFTNNTVEYLFDGPTKQWMDISNLDLTSPVPFSTRDQTGLAASLACELADFFGAEVTPATFELQRRFKLGLTNDLTESGVSNESRGTYF